VIAPSVTFTQSARRRATPREGRLRKGKLVGWNVDALFATDHALTTRVLTPVPLERGPRYACGADGELAIAPRSGF
jgi:hypothetical protein